MTAHIRKKLCSNKCHNCDNESRPNLHLFEELASFTTKLPKQPSPSHSINECLQFIGRTEIAQLCISTAQCKSMHRESPLVQKACQDCQATVNVYESTLCF